MGNKARGKALPPMIWYSIWLQIGTLIFTPKGLNHSRRAAPYVARPQACILKGDQHMGAAMV